PEKQRNQRDPSSSFITVVIPLPPNTCISRSHYWDQISDQKELKETKVCFSLKLEDAICHEVTMGVAHGYTAGI
ncbi:hypothetical protein ACQP3L_37920, partial [Escherichia coli]